MIIELLRHFGTISVSNTRRAGVLGLVCLSFICSSCMTVGQEFSESHVSDIRIGKTTQADVRNMFGSPWRVGVENGQRTWTYGKYHYQLIGPANTKDLVIRFDANNVVASYSFNTTNHPE